MFLLLIIFQPMYPPDLSQVSTTFSNLYGTLNKTLYSIPRIYCLIPIPIIYSEFFGKL